MNAIASQSPATRLFEQLSQTNTKENTKAPHYWSFVTTDRWIPLTKGQ